MSTPMDDIHALLKRVVSEVDDLADVLHFAVIPRTNGPDMIAISFGVKSDAVKSSDEIESDSLADDFFEVLGDMDWDDDGISGGDEAADEMSAAERERQEEHRRNRIQEMLDSLEDGDEVP